MQRACVLKYFPPPPTAMFLGHSHSFLANTFQQGKAIPLGLFQYLWYLKWPQGQSILNGGVTWSCTGPLCLQLFELPVWLDISEFFLQSRPLFGLVKDPFIFSPSSLFGPSLFIWGICSFECICLLRSDLSVLRLLSHLTVSCFWLFSCSLQPCPFSLKNFTSPLS